MPKRKYEVDDSDIEDHRGLKWFGTIWEEDIDDFKAVVHTFKFPESGVTGFGYQYEIGDEEMARMIEDPTHKPNRHVQIYIHFKDRQTTRAVMKKMGGKMKLKTKKDGTPVLKMSGGKWKPMEGTWAECKRYCSKDHTKIYEIPGDYWECEGFVEAVKGARTDIKRVLQCARERPLAEVIDNYPQAYARYSGAIMKAQSLCGKNYLRHRMQITYLIGHSGLGKSAYILDKYDCDQIYFALDTKEGWFDRYQGQKVIIFEEFHGLFPLGWMLQLLDGNPLSLPVKGGFTSVFPSTTTIYFASNIPLEMHYHTDSARAFQRRIHEWGRIVRSREELYADVEGGLEGSKARVDAKRLKSVCEYNAVDISK